MNAFPLVTLARIRGLVFGTLLILGARPADGFVILRPLSQDLESAVRWSAVPHEATGGAGLYDGIRVAIEPETAEAIAIAVTGEATPEDVAALDAAAQAAFGAWESSVLRFTVELDGPAERGPLVGAEIDVFAVPESDPVFQGNNFFGRTDSEFVLVDDRVLTNGDALAGFAFIGADIYLNLDMLAVAGSIFDREQQLAAFQRLLMHEIGHAVGLHHANEFVEQNYDTDTDPLNVMVIDPQAPLADLILSPAVDANAVVSNLPTTLEALLRTTLANDDRGGRDVLYPGPPLTNCPADCDADGVVSIAELLRGISVSRGSAFFLECPAADRNRDFVVRVNELVAGVRAALEGCPAAG